MRLAASFVLIFFASSLVAAEQQIEKTWGDWSKICIADANEVRVCQIVQSANQNESGQLIFQTAIGYVADNDKPIMYLTAPLGIFLPRGISVILDENPPITATVQRCDGNGCLALLALEPDFVATMKKAETAKLIFAASAQQNVSIPLSLKGFNDAFGAVSK